MPFVRIWLDDERDPKDPSIQEDFRASGDEIWVKTWQNSLKNNLFKGKYENWIGMFTQ